MLDQFKDMLNLAVVSCQSFGTSSHITQYSFQGMFILTICICFEIVARNTIACNTKSYETGNQRAVTSFPLLLYFIKIYILLLLYILTINESYYAPFQRTELEMLTIHTQKMREPRLSIVSCNISVNIWLRSVLHVKDYFWRTFLLQVFLSVVVRLEERRKMALFFTK